MNMFFIPVWYLPSVVFSNIFIVFIFNVILEVNAAVTVTGLLHSKLLFGFHVEKSPVCGFKLQCTKSVFVKQFFVQSLPYMGDLQ